MKAMLGEPISCESCRTQFPARRRRQRFCSQQCRNNAAGSQRERMLRTRYGITSADFNVMFREQNGRCAICERGGTPLVVDHCHTTGRVRRLLCHPCNVALAHVERGAFVRAAKDYLAQHAGDGGLRAMLRRVRVGKRGVSVELVFLPEDRERAGGLTPGDVLEVLRS